jgi:hypothetical protein
VWREAVLSDEEGKAEGFVKIIVEGEKTQLDANKVALIRVPHFDGLNKEEYTAAIVLIQKALQAGFKVTW